MSDSTVTIAGIDLSLMIKIFFRIEKKLVSPHTKVKSWDRKYWSEFDNDESDEEMFG